MTSSRENTDSFIVRIWREPREFEGAAPTWRGMIEHVASGQRRYIKDLDDIAAFIRPYLGLKGERPTLRWRLKQWRLCWKRRD